MARTTLLLPDDVYWPLQKWAADEHRPLQNQILHLLIEALREHPEYLQVAPPSPQQEQVA